MTLDDSELIERVILGSPERSCQRWVHVNDAFRIGQFEARKLCERFAVDPDQWIGWTPSEGPEMGEL